jgi:hypothetical protein
LIGSQAEAALFLKVSIDSIRQEEEQKLVINQSARQRGHLVREACSITICDIINEMDDDSDAEWHGLRRWRRWHGEWTEEKRMIIDVEMNVSMEMHKTPVQRRLSQPSGY